MKLAYRLTALSALAAASLTGTAAFAAVPLPSAQPNGSGVIVSVWDTTRQVSLLQYLNFDTQNASSLATGTNFTLTDFGTAFGSQTSNLVFTIEGAFSGTSSTTAWVTSGPLSGIGAVQNNNVSGANTAVNGIIQALNTECSGGPSCVSDLTQPTALHPTAFAGGANFGSTIGANLNNAGAAGATGAVGGSPIAWYYAQRSGISSTAAANVSEIGTGQWTLTTDGVLHYAASSAVPLPAAIWLLLSGLAGVVTVGRRKVAA